MQWARKQSGFTIVELLIVVVVIAILAAITIVAYNGIQNRTHDSAIKADIRNLAQIIQSYEAEKGELPHVSTQDGGGGTTFPGIKFRPTKSSYLDTATSNLYVCRPQSGAPIFGIGAKSKSGNVFAYRSDVGFFEFTGTWGDSSVNCPQLAGSSSYWMTYGKHSNGTWWSWTD